MNTPRCAEFSALPFSCPLRALLARRALAMTHVFGPHLDEIHPSLVIGEAAVDFQKVRSGWDGGPNLLTLYSSHFAPRGDMELVSRPEPSVYFGTERSEVDWFRQQGFCTSFQSSSSGVVIAVGRDHDHRHIRSRCFRFR